MCLFLILDRTWHMARKWRAVLLYVSQHVHRSVSTISTLFTWYLNLFYITITLLAVGGFTEDLLQSRIIFVPKKDESLTPAESRSISLASAVVRQWQGWAENVIVLWKALKVAKANEGCLTKRYPVHSPLLYGYRSHFALPSDVGYTRNQNQRDQVHRWHSHHH